MDAAGLFCAEGKTAAVTVAVRGPGKKIAPALAENGAALYLASQASCLTTGSVVVVDGGHLAP